MRQRNNFYALFIQQMIRQEMSILVYDVIMSTMSVEDVGNPKNNRHWLYRNRGQLVHGHDGICGMSKHFLKPLKFCLMSHSL